MSRRIDIELTSALEDGSWTWRAAGARNPKGVVPGSVLPAGAKVGDELKVEVEQEIDGITILNVVHGRQKAERALLELLPTEREFQPVVETRAPGGRRRDDDRRDRRPRGDGKGGDRRDRRPRGDGDGRGDRPGGGRGDSRGDRPGGGRGDGDRRPRRDGDRGRRGPSFTPPPELPQRPKPQRLKPGKAHRNAVLAELPEEQRPIAELTLQGLAAVRQKVRDENQKAVADGRAAMPEATVMKMAEELLPKLRVAEWRDRAEAAQTQLVQLDLRDLRSVVAAANDPIVARDESTRALAAELTAALATKQEQELQLWFGDVDAALAVGRVVRALRLSSNPPKAGVPFPVDIAQRLVDSANASLAPMDPPERWIAMLEAAAFSPVRSQVKPQRKPDSVTDDLLATVTRLAPALPQVAELFDVAVDPKAPMPKPLRPGPRPGDKKDARGAKPEPKPKRGAKPDAAATETAAAPTDAVANTPEAAAIGETAEAEATVADTSTPDAGATDTGETHATEAGATQAETADATATDVETPDTADTSAPDAGATETDLTEADVTEAPDTSGAEADATDSGTPEADVAETDATETDAAGTDSTPGTDAAETDAAEAAVVEAGAADEAGVSVDDAVSDLLDAARGNAVLEAAREITAETDSIEAAAEARATTDEARDH
ncbi:MAG TPA: hypothetical protein VNQ73_14630 [Ilumatobacter sp.]|nr:hypothetical protein [Ilumatobacter sp.]